MYVKENNLESIRHSTNLLNYNTALAIFSKAPLQRTEKDRDTIISFLNSLPVIKQAFSIFANCKDVLTKCSEKFEYRTYASGEPIMYRGQKCKELIIILKGTVNAYDTKPCEDIAREQSTLQTLQNTTRPSLIAPKSKSKQQLSPEPKRQTTLIMMKSNSDTSGTESQPLSAMLTINRKRDSSGNGKAATFRELMKTEQNDVVNQDLPRQSQRISLRGPIKISPIKLARVPSNVSIELKEDQEYAHLLEEEKLLLKDKDVKKKYIQDGVCLLTLKTVMRQGDIINSDCLKQEYRSAHTIISVGDTETITLSRETFKELFEGEFATLQEKIEYFTEFFNVSKHYSMGSLFDYIVKKTYILHDKIYGEDDIANGLYFIKTGAVRCCATLHSEPKDSTPDTADNPLTAYVAMRREVIGAQWLQKGRDKVRRIHSEEPQSSSRAAKKAAIATFGQGNSFGEEGLVTSQKRRAHAAFAATASVEVYFLGSQYYSTVQLLYPMLVQTLIDKAKVRNSWLEERVEDVKEVRNTLIDKENASANKGMELAATLKYYKPPVFSREIPKDSSQVSKNSLSSTNLRKDASSDDFRMQLSEIRKFSRNLDDEKNKIETCMRIQRKRSPEDTSGAEKSQHDHLDIMSSLISDTGTLPVVAKKNEKRQKALVDNNSKSSYLQEMFNQIAKKAQDYNRSNVTPEKGGKLRSSFSDKMEHLIQRNFFSQGDNRSLQTETTDSPVNNNKNITASKVPIESEPDVQVRPNSPILKLRTLVGRNQSLPQCVLKSARSEISQDSQESLKELENEKYNSSKSIVCVTERGSTQSSLYIDKEKKRISFSTLRQSISKVKRANPYLAAPKGKPLPALDVRGRSRTVTLK